VGRTFTSSFLDGDAAARAAARSFLARDFREPAARVASARAAAARRIDAAALEALREQQARLPTSAARDGHLKALAAGDTAVVVTGQQVGLFVGPLYTFYKAASAIAMARALEAESGVRCVPLFWLQTEDHDFAEIARCRVRGGDGAPVTLALADERPEDARVSVAHRRLGPEVGALVDALAAALAGAPAAAEVTALVRAHYVAGRPLAGAFAGLIAALFADEGLLVFDPRDARVARAAAPLYARALDRAPAIEAGLRARGAALEAAGLDQQIPVREGCALLFFHPHARGAEGPRFRLRRDGPRWGLAGADEVLDDVAVRRALEGDPLRFSTSALLRPPVQDALLPTAAYVGGPAEVSYFAQLGPVYDELGLPQPLVAPRARFRVVDAATRRRLAQLGLAAADADRPRAELLARVAAAHAGGARPEDLRRRVADAIAPAVDALAREVTAAEPGLARAADRTRASVARALDRLLGRYAHDLGARDAAAVARLDEVLRALAPGGASQERVYAWPSLAARHGAAAFKALVLARLAETPFPTEALELTP
jgi:bacillithiol biosynthesis cysteine-adding enzyme BshC